jgi:hypothetical protein
MDDLAFTKKEKRIEIRRPAVRAAIIQFSGPTWPIPCLVLNVTYGGAHIHVHEQTEIPDTFQFRIEPDTTTRTAEVVWRRGSELGVKFIG